MKITSKIDSNILDTEILITSKTKDELTKIIDTLKNLDLSIVGKKEEKSFQIHFFEIYFFENIDKKTYAYTKDQIFEISKWLNEIEFIMPPSFFRCSKSTIINLSKVKSFVSSFGSKIIVNLQNKERIMVSRSYVHALKEKLKGE